MADSLLGPFLQTLNGQTAGELADALGEAPGPTLRAAELGVMSVLAGLASKCRGSGLLRRLIELAPPEMEDLRWQDAIRAFDTPRSRLVAAGQDVISGAFGSAEPAVVNDISRETGLGQQSTSDLLTMAGLVVTSVLGQRAREEALSMNSVCDLLERESPAIRETLPASLTDLFWPSADAARGDGHASAPATPNRRSANRTRVLALAAAAVAVWVVAHRLPSPGSTGSASRIAPDRARLGASVKRRLPNGKVLKVPEYGVESRLLAFIRDPNAKPDETTWFTFDRIAFAPDSPDLRAESREQLNNVAAILNSYPQVQMKIAGYTDNAGDPRQNLLLSHERADAVKSELSRRGVTAGRLSTEGYGEQYPIGDNSTGEGRARNRRVAMRVTRK